MCKTTVRIGGLAAGAAVFLVVGIGVGLGPRRAKAADKDCSDFANQAQAQGYFVSHGGSASNNFDNLDADHDGVACEALPCPCSSSSGSGGGGGGGHPQPATRTKAEVIDAVDGDTLSVRLPNGSQRDVRLIGIDTPETVRPGTPVQCGGPQASTSMHGLADGRHVTLVSDPTQDRVDRYGRLLDYVFHGRQDLGKIQLRRGWAEVYVYAHNPFEKVRTFKHAEHRAESADRGVWRNCGGNFHAPQ
jgi:endonuclease YncB( thermonuclease family)